VGYEFYISRGKNWVNNRGFEISLEEWQAIVDRDPELHWVDLHANLDSALRHDAIWDNPRVPGAWLGWSMGNIKTKSYDPELIEKMIEISKKLSAKVQGDDREVYISGTQFHYEDS
jgi:hypothetical protein